MDDRPTGSAREGGIPHATARLPPAPVALPAFRRHGDRQLARQFGGVRLDRSHRADFTAARERPLIVYFNCSSWWDPLICLQLAAHLLPERRHFAPVSAAALARSRLLDGIGLHAVDDSTARRARVRQQLAAASRVLEQPDATLWIAPGWRQADPRQRPVELGSWFGHLVSRLHRGVLLPLAIEYPFWDSPLPEVLVRFGEGLAIEDAGMRAHDWTAVLSAQLQQTQDRLAENVLARDRGRFEPLLGAAGSPAREAGQASETGPLHRGLPAMWRRLQARLRRRGTLERGALPP